jgi:hypothetical protein
VPDITNRPLGCTQNRETGGNMASTTLIRADFTKTLRTRARKNIEPRWPQFDWSSISSAISLDPYHLKLIEEKFWNKPFPTRELLSSRASRADHVGKRAVKLISRALLVNKLLTGTDVEIDVHGAMNPDPTVVFKVGVSDDEVRCACYDYIAGEDDPITKLYNTEAETEPYDRKGKEDKGGLVVCDDLINDLVGFDVQACIEKRKAGFARMMSNPKVAEAMAELEKTKGGNT